MLTEQITPTINYLVHVPISDVMRFENPAMLKVITNLITQSENNLELIKVSFFRRNCLILFELSLYNILNNVLRFYEVFENICRDNSAFKYSS